MILIAIACVVFFLIYLLTPCIVVTCGLPFSLCFVVLQEDVSAQLSLIMAPKDEKELAVMKVRAALWCFHAVWLDSEWLTASCVVEVIPFVQIFFFFWNQKDQSHIHSMWSQIWGRGNLCGMPFWWRAPIDGLNSRLWLLPPMSVFSLSLTQIAHSLVPNACLYSSVQPSSRLMSSAKASKRRFWTLSIWWKRSSTALCQREWSRPC